MVFYVLEIATSGTSSFATFTVRGRPNFSAEPPRCRICSTEIGSRVWLPPYRINIEARSIGDVVSDGTNFILSDKARKAFEGENITGISFSNEPVETGRMDAGKFWVAFPMHVLTRLDEIHSGVVIEEVVGCDTCRVIQREKLNRLRIDETSWHGEDIFYPSGLFGVIVVTQRLVEIVKKNGLSNFTFIHQDAYSEDWNF